MYKFISALGLIALSSIFIFGQSDIKKGEFYVGYSNGQIDTGVDSGNTLNAFFRDRANFNGFEASGVYNFSRWFGIKGDFSAHFQSQRLGETFPNSGVPVNVTTKNDNSLYNYLGGIQVKDNRNSGTWKPFAHAMIGAATARSKFTELTCTTQLGTTCPTGFTNETISNTGFAGAFGGGLDIRINDHFQVRAIQIDYNPVHIGGFTDNNARIGAGIVF